MSITTPTTGTGYQAPFPNRRFTVDEYHHLIQTGVLTEDDPVELLEGRLVTKMPHNPPHDGTIQVTDEVIHRHLPTGWRIRIQSAITTTDSEPEPDLVIARGNARTYLTRHPGPQDIATLIEVADSSLARDRGDKSRLYARASIAIYWIINLGDLQVEVYTDPTGPDPTPTFRQRQDYGLDDAVPLVIGGQEVARIPVRDLSP